MPCLFPNHMFWSGNFTETGKLDLVMMPGQTGDLCNAKIIEKKSRYHKIAPVAPLVKIGSELYIKDPIPVPCGHCVGCRMDHAKEWKVRFTHEMESRPDLKAYFVTLTYVDQLLPTLRDTGLPYLRKADLRDFLERFRRPAYGVKVENIFFACGEYGDLNHRPHFHILMLTPELHDLVPYEFGSYRSHTIGKAWRYRGRHDVKLVEPNMVAYVCGYTEKKQNDPLWPAYPVKPFTIKSRGLGFGYISNLQGLPDRKVYGNFGGKHFAGIPRAYLRKCEDADWFDSYKADSILIGCKSLDTRLAGYGIKDADVLGSILEAYAYEELEKKRNLKL